MSLRHELVDVSVPGTLPVYPGIDLAGRYVLTDHPPTHRGDGLKAFALPGSRVALVVGDAVGTGAAASGITARLLAILRNRLEEGHTPHSAMQYIDRYADTVHEAAGATVLLAVLSLDTGRLEYAAAGHPAPVRLGADGAQLLPLAASRPLGTGGCAAAATAHLAPGEMLVMHTNGLVASTGRTLLDAEQHMCQLLTAFNGRDPTAASPSTTRSDRLCQLLVGQMPSDQEYSDDVAILVAERTTSPPSFSESGAATADYVADVADGLEEWLDTIGAGLLDHMVIRQAFCELGMNVVRHAYLESPAARRTLDVRACLDDDGALTLHIQDAGRWQESPTSEGRGLIIAGGLVDSMCVDRSARGTTVTLRQKLGRSVPVLLASHVLPGPIDGANHPARVGPTMQTEAARGRVRIWGAVEERCTQEFQDAVHEASRAGTRDLVVDLTGVTLLASAAVRVLFEYLVRAQSSGTRLTVSAAPESIAHHVLKLVDFPHSRD